MLEIRLVIKSITIGVKSTIRNGVQTHNMSVDWLVITELSTQTTQQLRPPPPPPFWKLKFMVYIYTMLLMYPQILQKIGIS